jgi:hypothetical protein
MEFFGSSERFFRFIGGFNIVIGTIIIVVGFFIGIFGNVHLGMLVVWITSIIAALPFWFGAALMYWFAEMLENVKSIREDIQSIRQDTTYATKMTHEFYKSLQKSK